MWGTRAYFERNMHQFSNFDDREYVSERDAAHFLDVPIHCIVFKRKSGVTVLPFSKKGKKFQYRVGDLRNYVENKLQDHLHEYGRLRDV